MYRKYKNIHTVIKTTLPPITPAKTNAFCCCDATVNEILVCGSIAEVTESLVNSSDNEVKVQELELSNPCIYKDCVLSPN